VGFRRGGGGQRGGAWRSTILGARKGWPALPRAQTRGRDACETGIPGAVKSRSGRSARPCPPLLSPSPPSLRAPNFLPCPSSLSPVSVSRARAVPPPWSVHISVFAIATDVRPVISLAPMPSIAPSCAVWTPARPAAALPRTSKAQRRASRPRRCATNSRALCRPSRSPRRSAYVLRCYLSHVLWLIRDVHAGLRHGDAVFL
jgi:hypothetical protein